MLIIKIDLHSTYYIIFHIIYFNTDIGNYLNLNFILKPLMYFKNSKSIKQAKNPCNQHIVQYLHQKRLVCYQSGNKQLFFVYGRAIQSVQNYILPIISEKQLSSLKGIGQSLKSDLIGHIHQYYKEFLLQKKLAPSYDVQYQDKKQNENLSIVSQVGDVQNDQLANQTIRIRGQSKENNVVSLLIKQQQDQQCKSQIIDRTYHPRAKSAAAYILIALTKLQHQGNLLNDKQQINTVIEQSLGEKPIKSWNTNVNNLQRHKYIQVEKDNRKTCYKLTEKGKQFAIRISQKTSMLKSKNKAITLVKQFKQNKQEQKKQIQIQSNEMNFKDILHCQAQRHELFVLIDVREIKTQVDRKFFEEKLTQRGIKCQIVALSVGDFAYAIKDNMIQQDSKSNLNQFYILNYVIQRKKADDLASSIVDGRYKEQRHRLKQSGIDNIYYIYEGSPSTSSNLSEKQLQTALLSTRVRGFKIVKTKNIVQSVKFIASGYEQIMGKMTRQKSVQTIGSFHEFNLRNNKTKWCSVSDVFIQSIRCIPGVGKGSATKFSEYFGSFKQVYDKLEKMQSNEEKLAFLKELMKGTRISKQFPIKLIEILFADEYDKKYQN